MLKRRKPIKVTRSKEKLSNRIGVPLVEEIVNKLYIHEKIDELFGKRDSIRGIPASYYVMTLVYMFYRWVITFRVRHLQSDEAFQEMLKEMKLPTSDAIGNWLRRNGSKHSEKKMLEVIRQLLKGLSNPEARLNDLRGFKKVYLIHIASRLCCFSRKVFSNKRYYRPGRRSV